MTTPPVPDPPAAGADARPTRRFRRFRRVPHPPWRSRRGILLLFLLAAGFGSIVTVSGAMAVHYSETTSFCGRCHTMDAELKAHQMSAHRELSCAECHVQPGVAGWVRAKATGTKQLIQIMTGSYPRPIPPPDHARLPSIKDTCLRCHSVERITRNGGPLKLVLRPTYQPDEKNTRELVAVVLRPSGLGSGDGVLGVHWHVQQQVTYSTTDRASKKIDLVEITRPGGHVEQYIAAAAVGVSNDVRPDIERLRSTESSRVMDCLDCHNRVGHGVPSTDQALDESMSAGRISASLPFIKRDGVALLNASYPSVAAADSAIEGLRATYQERYPLVLRRSSTQVTGAIDELKRVYRLLATPEMKVQARTYPDNLGHRSAPGCFRCHDGTHYQVVGGTVTSKKIPSACATCHIFPQIGGRISGLLIGGEPADHASPRYVFTHKIGISGTNPAGTACARCHDRTYCENCHNTGAVTVQHDQMLYNHPASIRRSGGQACGYCHQEVYCAGCHNDPVLLTPASPG
ncbi:MAG: NapC/NirT family cytochrome c [Actinobacteria bacterium]|nr:NapC/NirT family cytochrome c [Actinomycetota bacterium]MBI3686877.1 NapC/NirT family cytochrome c [Actinomycetota bacterium]